MDEGFEGEDLPTRVSEPEFVPRRALAEDRVRVERVANARPPQRKKVPLAPYTPLPRELEAEAPVGGGFGKGLAVGFGAAGLLFGFTGIAVAGVLVATHSFAPQPAGLAAIQAPVKPGSTPWAVIAKIEAPPVLAATPVATPVLIAKVIDTPLPVATPRVVVAKVVATSVVKPEPTPVVVAKAAPIPPPKAIRVTRVEPTPAPRPSHDELLSLATSARRVATPTPVPAQDAAAAFEPFNPGADAATPEPAAAASTPDPELAGLLAPTPTVSKKEKARDSAERVIHSRKGDKPVTVNANIALTRADGKTFVGKLVAVNGGFVDVKTADTQLRISETDVVDAATY